MTAEKPAQVTTSLPFPVLYEDNHLLVIDKPAGLLTQGESTGDENLVDLLRKTWGRPFVGLIHRLDRNTSGLMVVGKRTKGSSRLSESLRNGQLERKYLAWVLGKIQDPAQWTHELVKNEKTNTTLAQRQSTPGSKSASLRAHPLTTLTHEGITLTLVQFTLETGRSHQIRAQTLAEGHPLLGDLKYGSLLATGLSPIEKSVFQKFGRPALHSYDLSFPHPTTHERMHFQSNPPRDFQLIRHIDVQSIP